MASDPKTSTQPYAGLRVIELSNDPAGEQTGLLLAQMGAHVLKLEPEEGCASRHTGPFAGDKDDKEFSLAFWYYNSNKESVVLDDTGDGKVSRLKALLKDADIFIVTKQPAELADLGLDLRELVELFPRLIVLSITPFGLDGPWADYMTSDLVGLAAGGPLHMCGYDDHSIPPIRPGGNQGFHTAASFAHTSVLLALLSREQTGQGQLVDVSMHEALAVTVELANPYWFYPRVLVRRQTCRHAQPTMTQPALFQCSDGRYVYFVLILAENKAWSSFVNWMDSKGLAADLIDDAFNSLEHRQKHMSHIHGITESFFLIHDAETMYREGQERGLPIGVLNAPEDLLEYKHLQVRGFFDTVDHEGIGPVQYPGAPFRFSAFSGVARRPAPALGSAGPVPADEEVE